MPMNPMVSNYWLILIAAIAYLLGSFPTAYFVARRMLGKDIRVEGSGNVGAMNVYSLAKAEKSKRLAIAGLAITVIGDMAKGVLAIYIARWLGFLGYNPMAALIISSSLVILGHNYPFVFRFRQGGRGIATFMGILVALNPPALPIWLGTVFVCIIIAQYAQGKKIDWKNFPRVFSVIGTQTTGRIIGIPVALASLYGFDHRLLFPSLAAIILILIRHTSIIKASIQERRQHQITP
ncbi:MAG: glycerol-3-phosphate acyltransferase [Dehalococcoidales bacterium]|nr:glycerol-3-phosphate acyltransferase [Dehalococcoidales bacterium]